MFKKNLTNIQKITIGSFLLVPLLSSFISTIHIVDFFGLGNYKWMAVLLAIAFEIGSIASALSITVLDKIKKWVIFSMFFILIFFQIVGNVYFSFNYISGLDTATLKNAQEFFGYFVENNITDFKIYLSFLIGLPIPLISLAFLKSLVDYLGKLLEDDTTPLPEDINVKVAEVLENDFNIKKRQVPIPEESTELDEPVSDVVNEEIAEIEESTNEEVQEEPEIDPSLVIVREPMMIKENQSEASVVEEEKVLTPEEAEVEEFIKGVTEKARRNPHFVKEMKSLYASGSGKPFGSK